MRRSLVFTDRPPSLNDSATNARITPAATYSVGTRFSPLNHSFHLQQTNNNVRSPTRAPPLVNGGGHAMHNGDARRSLVDTTPPHFTAPPPPPSYGHIITPPQPPAVGKSGFLSHIRSLRQSFADMLPGTGEHE
jgi:hypothetical protein